MTNEIASDPVRDLETKSVPHDFTLDVDCVELLCRQELLLSRMADRGSSLSFENLDLAKQMLAHHLTFCETYFDGEPLEVFRSRMSDLYEQVRELESSLMGNTWRTVRRLFGAKSEDELAITTKYQELGKDFAEFHADVFTYCVESSSAAPSVKGQFLESVKAFLTEVGEKW
jgi:hypothetical protein